MVDPPSDTFYLSQPLSFSQQVLYSFLLDLMQKLRLNHLYFIGMKRPSQTQSPFWEKFIEQNSQYSPPKLYNHLLQQLPSQNLICLPLYRNQPLNLLQPIYLSIRLPLPFQRLPHGLAAAALIYCCWDWTTENGIHPNVKVPPDLTR